MEKILLGTYTKNTSEGIYSIDLVDGHLVNLSLVAKAQNPTYLDYDATTGRLYSIAQKDALGGIAVWDYNGKTATLAEEYMQEGVQPCYVRYDKDEDVIYDANYHRGTFTTYGDGEVQKVFEYQKGAHAHFADIDPKTKDVFVCDLGNDAIHKYRLLNEIATYKTTEGMGPRHLVFHPTAPYIYILGELNNTVEVVKDLEFEFELVQAISTLPEEGIQSGGGAIRISDDGKFVYATNRGHDSITTYKIEEDYTLTVVSNDSVHGGHPRDFALSLDQNYLVVANRDANNLVLFKRDVENGTLTYIEEVDAPEVVATLFIEVA